MKKFTQQQIIDTMAQSGLVPLFTHADATLAQEVIDAAYKGGVRVFEFTNRLPNSFDVFQSVLKYFEKYPDLMLGIGTVMDAATTRRFIDAGVHFIISPILKPEMAAVCREQNMLWIPGCATLTEIVTAKELGAGVIKVFPGSVLGPGFVSAITPVVPGLKLMITGGVEPTEANMSAWLNAGATCVGLGSQLFTKEIIAEKNWAQLEQKVAAALKIIRSIRKT
ncbi:bifunctional 4-hydroxy-2-oxoglutarate aldolase/2-dehydro-3-deoxy-phosphogluconate aldolase [Fulvivirgaceae bacterium PWU5]|uniref:Bifunctional 4-hydroxy-2-oxoglutarate aldolase/2-dehydro-3-deoxy-phosphogluconate aldolase n=1 Tax=Dawidia cretensis TaxID=2782350 RepID=A0AAP2GVL4_9BACT|nr:bifunctional 4-hydroxy-2-oxoglutarate aldolase/2-dehydro-3-deoxy-phosphogluconate aldolase [Dawidia cretensis]MBT1711058.1 bifunctional 4-hydroxy-2-oxoglutarate aldolase/2-dehydro-3-deoxy-phosphogluconate aldolase [Dawidia cretensis]